MESTEKTQTAHFFKQAIDALSYFFKTLSKCVELLGQVVVVNLYNLILLVIIYLLYWIFLQAKDLLLTINQESHFQISLFFTSLVTLARICWYMPRYFYAENQAPKA